MSFRIFIWFKILGSIDILGYTPWFQLIVPYLQIGVSTPMTNVQSSHLGPPPKSPARTIVRAHLGDHGHTFVPTKPGITVRDALSKAMKLRKLVPETCAVYRCSDPSKVICREQ